MEKRNRSASNENAQEILALNLSFDKIKKTKIFQKFLLEEQAQKNRQSPLQKRHSRRQSLQDDNNVQQNQLDNNFPNKLENSQFQDKLRQQYYSPDNISDLQQQQPINQYLNQQQSQLNNQSILNQQQMVNSMQLGNQFDDKNIFNNQSAVQQQNNSFVQQNQQRNYSQVQNQHQQIDQIMNQQNIANSSQINKFSQDNPQIRVNNFMGNQNQNINSKYNSLSPEKELMGYSQMIPSNLIRLNQQPVQQKENFNQSIKDENKSLDYAIHASLPNDIFELKSWVIDLRKEVENQKLLNQQLQDKNKEQELFLHKQRDNYETFRNRVLNDNYQDKNEMVHLQDQIMNLQEKIYEVQKNEDNLQIENKSLKDKHDHEQLIRVRLEEKVREEEQKNKQIEDQLQQKQKFLDRKEDDYLHMKQIDDQNKLKIITLSDKIESLEDQLRKANQFISKDQDDKELNLQKLREIQGKSQQLQQEMDVLRQDNKNLQSQLFQKETQLENFKGEVYQNKQQNLDKNQKEINLQMQIEKLSVEVQQLRALLNQSEMEMRTLKDHNSHLLNQIQNMAHQRGFDLSDQYLQLQKTLQDKEKLAQNAMQAQQRLLEQQAYQQQFQQQQQQQQQDVQRGRQGYQEIYQLEESKNYTPQKQQPQQIYNQTQNDYKQEEYNDIDIDFNYQSRSPERTKIIKPKDQGIFYKEEETKVSASPPGKRHMNQIQNSLEQNQNQSNVYARPRVSNQHQDIQQKQLQEKFDYDQYMKQFQMNKSRSRKALQQEYLNNNYNNQSPPQRQQRNQSPIYQNENPQQFQTSHQTYGNTQGVEATENTIHNLEKSLMEVNMEKEKLDAEIKKLEQSKRTGQTIKRKREAEQELEILEKSISNLKIQLRKMNALHRH